MKKQLCILLLIIVQLNFAQQQENETNKQASLTTLQPITVTIGGNFIITGSFLASRYQRLDQFITTYFTQAQLNAVRGLTQYEEIQAVNKEINKFPLRGITLKRSTGELIKIDLLKYRLTGDFKYNPYLMNDDVIIFPSYDSDVTIVDISGAVNKPTKFQFIPGDKLEDAILFAGGLNQSYENIEKAEISRLDKSGNKEQLFTVNIHDAFMLESGDRIRILADENQKKNFRVLVLGQVKNPGYVYVTRDGITLPEAIKKAGGITDNADLKKAEVIRDYNSIEMLSRNFLTLENMTKSAKVIQADLELKRLKESMTALRLANITPDEDTLFFRIDNSLRVLRTESLVDFSKLNEPNSDESKFLVKDDDIILIPDKFEYVYVFGQVPKLGYVKYEAGKDFKYYIDKAGGLAETARGVEKSVIIKGKEKNWITEDKEKIAIEPGDMIYVPKDAPLSFWNTITKLSTLTTLVSSAATIIFFIIQIGKL